MQDPKLWRSGLLYHCPRPRYLNSFTHVIISAKKFMALGDKLKFRAVVARSLASGRVWLAQEG